MPEKRLLIVSFDAVGSEELVHFGPETNLMKLARNGTLFKDTKSIVVSNTYPVHSSVNTGVVPGVHGLISNTKYEPAEYHGWNWDCRALKSRTLWQAAHGKGLSVATVMWPLTGYAGKDITFNMPEILAGPDQNQIMENMKAGNVWFQLVSFAKFKHLLAKGDVGSQPEKDNFATTVMENLLRKQNRKGNRINLMMLHLTAYDSACHNYGKHSPESLEALKWLDDFLGRILALVDSDTDVLVFSDHSQVNLTGFCDPQGSFSDKFHNEDLSRFYFYYCGGTCFCFNRGMSPDELEKLKEDCLGERGVRRLLTEGEMTESGFAQAGFSFGLSAEEGFSFDTKVREKAEHGFTLDTEHYRTFILSSWKTTEKCTSVLDVTKLAARSLGLGFKEGEGLL